VTWPALPTPEAVDVEQDLLAVQSDWRDGMLHSRRVDAATPRRFTLRWDAASAADASAIRTHAQTYLGGREFSWTTPGGSPLTVVYDSPEIDFDRVSAARWRIRLSLVEALVTQT
jgi:hypothetical protein